MDSSIPTDLKSRISELQKYLTDGDPHQPSLSVDALLDGVLALYNEVRQLEKQSEGVGKFVKKYDTILSKLQRLRVNIYDFEIIKPLAKGAFANVCLVRGKHNKKVYAMKILRKKDLLTKREAAYFMEERNALVFASASQWITTLHASFQDEENLYLVMEYAPGGSLRNLSYSREDPMTEEEVRFYAAEIICALEELHSLRFVHRDVKPDNCLIDADGHVKLADFGSCIRMDDRDMVTSLETVGTPDYIPPEILRSHEGKVSYGRECDWWSLGIIVYELLFDEVPFYSDSLAETYCKIMDHEKHLAFPDEPSVSDEAKNLIRNLLCDKENRLGRKGVHEIKNHPWFKGTDWSNIRKRVPPFLPELKSEEDTTYFEDEEGDEFKPPIRKLIKNREFLGSNLPFIGYTYFQQAQPTIVFQSPDGDGSIAASNSRLHRVESRSTINSEKQLDNMSMEVLKLNDRITQEKEKVSSLLNIKQTLEVDLKQRNDKIIALKEANSAKAELEKQVKSLEKELEDAQARVEELDFELGELSKSKASLESQVSTMQKRIENEKKQKFEAEEKLTEIEIRLRTEMAKVSDLEVTKAQYADKQSRIQEELTSTKEMLKMEEERVESLSQQNATLKKQISEKETQMNSIQSQLDSALATIKTLERDLADARRSSKDKAQLINSAEFESLKSKLELESGLKQKALEEVVELKKKISTLDNEISDSKKAIVSTTLKTQTLKMQKEALQQQFSEESHKVLTLEQTNNRLVLERDGLKTDLETAQKELEHEEKSRKASEHKIWDLEKEIAILEADRDNLNKKLEGELQQKEAMMVKIKQLTDLKAEVTEARNQAESKSLTLESENEKLTNDLNEVRTILDELQREIDQYRTEVLDLNQNHETLRHEYEDLYEMHQNECQLRSKLEGEYDALEHRLQDTLAAKEQLRQQNEDLQQRIHELEQQQHRALADDGSASSLRMSEDIKEGRMDKVKRRISTRFFTGGKSPRRENKANPETRQIDSDAISIDSSLVLSGHSRSSTSNSAFSTDVAAQKISRFLDAFSVSNSSLTNLNVQHANVDITVTHVDVDNMLASPVQPLDFKNGVFGYLKMPKGERGIAKNTWKKRYAVLREFKIRLYEKEKDNEPLEVIDISADVFWAKPVSRNELIHASPAQIECIFKIQFGNFDSSMRSISNLPSQTFTASITNLSSFPDLSTAGASTILLPDSSIDIPSLEAKIQKLSEEITTEEKINLAAIKMLQVSPAGSRANVQQQVEATERRIARLNAELDAMRAKLKNTGSTMSVHQSSMEVSIDDNPTKASQEDLSRMQSELEKRINTEQKKKEGFVHMLKLIGDKNKQQKDYIVQELEGCERSLRESINDLDGLKSDNNDTIQRVLKRISHQSAVVEISGHHFKMKNYNTPMSCQYCYGPLWGSSNQGFECMECKYVCHKNCEKLVDVTCEQMQVLRHCKPMYFMASSAEEKERWIQGVAHARKELEKTIAAPSPAPAAHQTDPTIASRPPLPSMPSTPNRRSMAV